MGPLKKEFGKHYLVEFLECDAEKLKFFRDVKNSLMAAAQKSKATILCDHYYQFDPYGVTGMIFIAESHFSIHTWPDDRYAAVDILTCGKMYPEEAVADLKSTLGAKEVRVQIIARGI